MIFKDRSDAGRQLAKALMNNEEIVKEKERLVVVSLLRGGVPVGYEIASKLGIPHFLLPVAKISAPGNQELAIGAVCGKEYFLDSSFGNQDEIEKQIDQARQKYASYVKKFKIKNLQIKGKTVILTDDGAATGASVMAAQHFLKHQKVAKIILALPVSPIDFHPIGFDKTIILHQDKHFHAVSQFYQNFSQVEDEFVLKR